MSKYIPNGWAIIKDNEENYYVFGSWSGGYLDGDKWRRNSGITKVEEDKDNYYFYGYTGSVYICSKEFNHISGYNAGILSSILGQGGILVEISELVNVFDIGEFDE